MSQALDELLSVLDLEPIEVNIFRGIQPNEDSQRVFGGQVIAQALVAAMRTVEKERQPHSLHAYFMRPGDPKVPILYEVDRIRDGGSFTTRRVVAIQHGRAIFSSSVSFHITEDGLSHQFDMPDVPPPDDLMPEHEWIKAQMDKAPKSAQKWVSRERPIEMRWTNNRDLWSTEKLEPVQHVWFRTQGDLPDDPLVHYAVLAYASDMSLLGTGMRAHGLTWQQGKVQSASLDHALWFHRPFRCDNWLLYSQDSPSTGGARSFNRGSIYTRDGQLAVSAAQEGLMRMMDPSKRK